MKGIHRKDRQERMNKQTTNNKNRTERGTDNDEDNWENICDAYKMMKIIEIGRSKDNRDEKETIKAKVLVKL